tara:strand:+ start:697 stop:804 length:108 start_codon:yes stop_codon:yes gene_type:complete
MSIFLIKEKREIVVACQFAILLFNAGLAVPLSQQH